MDVPRPRFNPHSERDDSEHRRDMSESPVPSEDAFRRRVVFVVGVVAFALAVGLVLLFQMRVLLLAFAGVLLAVFLVTLSRWLQGRLRLPYWAALTIMVVGLAAVAVGCLWLIGWRVSQQVDALHHELP